MAKALGLTDEIPFADLSVAISDVDYTGPHLSLIKAFACSAAEGRCCLAMLNWYGRRESASTTPEASLLPDLYLPLFHFFRLGATFSREHRVYIDVNSLLCIPADSIQKGELSRPFAMLDE